MNEWIVVGVVVAVVAALGMLKVILGYRQKVIVNSHEKALLFFNGKLVKELEAGETVLWGLGYEVKRVDGRWQELVVQSQEFLTADRASVKVSGVVRFRVADVLKYFGESQAPLVTIHTATQMALRDVVGSLGVEAVLERQDGLGDRMTTLVAATAEALGIEVNAVVARDLMLAGDLKRAYQATLSAKQEALAGLEKARGEAAAIRVKANAARVYEKNPALLQLEALETVAKLGDGMNNHLVLGSLDSLLKMVKTE